MDATVRKGRLCLYIEDLLNGLGPEERRELAEALALQDTVIKDVADQIVAGITDGGSRGRVVGRALALPVNGLDYATRLVAKSIDTVQRREIVRLEEALSDAKAEAARLAKILVDNELLP